MVHGEVGSPLLTSESPAHPTRSILCEKLSSDELETEGSGRRRGWWGAAWGMGQKGAEMEQRCAAAAVEVMGGVRRQQSSGEEDGKTHTMCW